MRCKICNKKEGTCMDRNTLYSNRKSICGDCNSKILIEDFSKILRLFEKKYGRGYNNRGS
jgi:hypothetical protein